MHKCAINTSVNRQKHGDRYAKTFDKGSASGSQKCENKINPTHHIRNVNKTPIRYHFFPSNGQISSVLKPPVQGMKWKSACEIFNFCRFYGEQFTKMHQNLKCIHSSHYCCLPIPSHSIFLSQ